MRGSVVHRALPSTRLPVVSGQRRSLPVRAVEVEFCRRLKQLSSVAGGTMLARKASLEQENIRTRWSRFAKMVTGNRKSNEMAGPL